MSNDDDASLANISARLTELTEEIDKLQALIMRNITAYPDQADTALICLVRAGGALHSAAKRIRKTDDYLALVEEAE